MLSDLSLRWNKTQEQMRKIGADACLVTSNTNLYYLTGMVINGYVYLPAEGEPLYFVRRPAGLEAPKVRYIRKPEDIPALLKENGLNLPRLLLLEGDQLPYNEHVRLQAALNPQQTGNVTSLMRQVRSIKTEWEINQFRISAQKHAEAYSRIKECYTPGITDLKLQINLEYVIRSLGSIGYFRGFGHNMEIYMGSVLTGENAGAASPFDFALGGAGIHPSVPVGANGSPLKEGTTVMVDMAGNFTAYLTDMTRTFAIGNVPDIAHKAHQVSIDIQDEIMRISKPGVACADLYNVALEMANAAQLGQYFMGTTQQAKFVGHGVGIEINELPVLTGRSKETLHPNMVLALEPKFVIPNVGAVGIENTFLVTATGLEKLTLFEEGLIPIIS